MLAFELDNREYFARSISDRGDAYFAEFGKELRDRLAEKEEGTGHYHVILDEHGEIIGRVNLILRNPGDGEAELGYRVAEAAAGQGVATAAVAELCQTAAAEYGLCVLIADVAVANQASRIVLERNDFTPIGETRVGPAKRPAVRYRRALMH